jgi:hypothetical protein
MPRIARTHKTSRLTLELPQTLRDRLEGLRDEVMADSLTEVVRRALALYGHCVDARKAGSQVIIRGDEGDTVIVFF